MQIDKKIEHYLSHPPLTFSISQCFSPKIVMQKMNPIRPPARLYTKTPKTEILLKKWADVSGSKMCIRNYDQLQTRAQISEGWPWIIILLVKPHFNKRVTDSHVFVLDLRTRANTTVGEKNVHKKLQCTVKRPTIAWTQFKSLKKCRKYLGIRFQKKLRV